MTLDKAIEIQSMSVNGGVTTFNQDFRDSQKLLIEAGKRIIVLRKYPLSVSESLLLGETEE